MSSTPMSVFVAILLASLPATALPARSARADESISLEQLLKRYRAEQEAQLAGLRVEFNTLVADLEAAHTKGKRLKLDSLRRQLRQLGSEATPLLVQRLDPGTDPSPAVIGRSADIAWALERLPTSNINVQLFSIYERGSQRGQANALRVLSHSDNPERVGAVLRGYFESADPERRASLINAIATLGGESNFRFIGQLLGDQGSELAESVLTALAQGKCAQAAPEVLKFVLNTEVSSLNVTELVSYYRANPETFDPEVSSALVQLLLSVERYPRLAEALLLLLSEHDDEWGNKIKKPLRRLSNSDNSRVSRAAQICLARAGDYRMRKKLLDPFEEDLAKNERAASTWQSRAEVKLLIADYKGAIKDFLEAQRLSAGYQSTSPNIYLGIARAYALQGKPKDAAKWITQAGFSLDQLHRLAEEPAFAELLNDKNYRKVFRLDDV